ncbi:hypothetical protein [Mycobacterium simiae]|uniref:hypothetical protein n=1 Tax=Mycobacterium simiae TaxID=1784 RepID=UPI0018C983D8|nr:hypothetical protein [Mycobacterium simiae]
MTVVFEILTDIVFVVVGPAVLAIMRDVTGVARDGARHPDQRGGAAREERTMG